jgi:hypothetical protein
MEITNPPQFVPYLKTPDGKTIGLYTLNIGAWDMDTNSGATVTHSLGVYWDKVLSVNVMIIKDSGLLLVPLNAMLDFADPNLLSGGVVDINSTVIQLRRRTGGLFDSANYSSILINRGYITFMVLY